MSGVEKKSDQNSTATSSFTDYLSKQFDAAVEYAEAKSKEAVEKIENEYAAVYNSATETLNDLTSQASDLVNSAARFADTETAVAVVTSQVVKTSSSDANTNAQTQSFANADEVDEVLGYSDLEEELGYSETGVPVRVAYIDYNEESPDEGVIAVDWAGDPLNEADYDYNPVRAEPVQRRRMDETDSEGFQNTNLSPQYRNRQHGFLPPPRSFGIIPPSSAVALPDAEASLRNANPATQTVSYGADTMTAVSEEPEAEGFDLAEYVAALAEQGAVQTLYDFSEVADTDGLDTDVVEPLAEQTQESFTSSSNSNELVNEIQSSASVIAENGSESNTSSSVEMSDVPGYEPQNTAQDSQSLTSKQQTSTPSAYAVENTIDFVDSDARDTTEGPVKVSHQPTHQSHPANQHVLNMNDVSEEFSERSSGKGSRYHDFVVQGQQNLEQLYAFAFNAARTQEASRPSQELSAASLSQGARGATFSARQGGEKSQTQDSLDVQEFAAAQSRSSQVVTASTAGEGGQDQSSPNSEERFAAYLAESGDEVAELRDSDFGDAELNDWSPAYEDSVFI